MGGAFEMDTHHTCPINCCSRGNREDLFDGKCRCIPVDKSYAIGGKSSWSCCARNAANTHSMIRRNKRCSCSMPGSTPNYGADESDCCTGKWDKDKKCIPRPCMLKGLAPRGARKCCRAMSLTMDGAWTSRDLTTPMDGDNCGCFHQGTSPSDYDDVDGKLLLRINRF